MQSAYSQQSGVRRAQPPSALEPRRNGAFQHFKQRQKLPENRFTGKTMDLYRDTPVRMLVFTNDVGEAFKLPLLKWFGHGLGTALYNGTYAVTGAYVALDTFDKGYKAYRKAGRQLNQESLYDIGTQTIGAGLFQFLAGYWIPVKIVHGIRKKCQGWVHHLTYDKFQHHTRLNLQIYLPAVISAMAIPVIFKPIDLLVEKGLRHTYWKASENLGSRIGISIQGPPGH